MGKHDHSDKHLDRESSSRRAQAVRRLRRIRRERHTRRLVTAGMITAITTAVVLAAVSGHVAEAGPGRALTEPIGPGQGSWPVDTVIDEIAVQRHTAQSAAEVGEAAEAEKRALDEAEAEQEVAEAEARAEAEAAAAAEAAKPDWVTPSDDHISSYFGQRWGRMHQGLDFANEDGEENLAAGAGTVTYSGWMSGYGNFVVIDHGGGIETAYGHAEELLVDVGDDVEPGDPVSLTGDSGHSTGPHLHFEVRIHGEQVDPLPWLEEHGVVPPETDD